MAKPKQLTGVQQIAEERKRQTKDENWTGEHDDMHISGELALAAICYAAPTRIYTAQQNRKGFKFIDPWPFSTNWDKRPYNGSFLMDPTPEERKRMLVKAGALLAAEIDRLDRLDNLKNKDKV